MDNGKVIADNTVVAITICVASSALFFISKAMSAVLTAAGTLYVMMMACAAIG